ncbi:fluoride efflux transporter FluC [Streptomyces sp. NPDC004031]
MADAAETVAAVPADAALFHRLFPHPTAAGLHAVWMTVLVAGGGAAGALARAGVGQLGTDAANGFPLITFSVNLAGCAAMGVLMAALHRRPASPMWAGPVLGSGFLGGFTTFSSYAADTQRLLSHGHAGLGVLYAAATVVGALLACAGGRALTVRLVRTAPAHAAAGR